MSPTLISAEDHLRLKWRIGSPETLVLYRKRADEKAVGPREGRDGALSIQPFEGSRVTTLWGLNWFFVLGGGSVHGKRVEA